MSEKIIIEFVNDWLDIIKDLEGQPIEKKDALNNLKKFKRAKINLITTMNEREYTPFVMQKLDAIEVKINLALKKSSSKHSLIKKEMQTKLLENIRQLFQDILGKIVKTK